MLVFTKKITKAETTTISLTVYLTAEARLKSQQRLEIPNGEPIYLRLPRGTILQEGDLLISENHQQVIAIAAQPEPVMTARSQNQLDLLKAAYHLGNRHVPLQITSSYLRFSPDSILANLLLTLGLEVELEECPFYPEIGAYKHSH